MPRRSWTATSPPSPTRSAPPPWTSSSRRPPPGSTPTQLARRHDGLRDRRGVHLDTSRTSLAGTVPLTGRARPPRRPRPATRPSPRAPPTSPPSAPPTPSTSAAPPPWARWPAPSSPSTSTTAAHVGRARRDHGHGRPAPRRKPKQVVLYLHLSDQALAGTEPLGRVGTTRTPVTADQIRAWCGDADQLDRQAGHRPPRPHPRHRLRGPRPHPRTRRPARPHLRLPLVHPTSRDLRRRPRPPLGHRWRTPRPTTSRPSAEDTTAPRPTARWSLTVLSPGEYLWRSPHGLVLLRDHTGTRLLDGPARPGDTLTTPPHTPPTAGPAACPEARRATMGTWTRHAGCSRRSVSRRCDA